MLIVKDFDKLKKHGFIHNENGLEVNEKGNPIWTKKIAEDEYENYISLLVNAYNANCEKDELMIYASIYSSDESADESADVCARIDEVFEMIADGTIEYVKENK